jgi:large subunit ribosomal protein L6
VFNFLNIKFCFSNHTYIFMKISFLKKNIIKIPKTVSVFFCINNILVIKGYSCIKAIKLKTQIQFYSKKKIIHIIPLLSKNYKKKKFKPLYNTYLSSIRQIIKETCKQAKKKLNIVGVGYKVIVLATKKGLFTILQLKLGYSHFIYIKIPRDLIVFCPKPNKIFFYGYNQQKINIISFLIKFYKMPESYKLKGIFYFNEQIKLKKGKKL